MLLGIASTFSPQQGGEQPMLWHAWPLSDSAKAAHSFCAFREASPS
jgi:hypothetical protein